MSVENGHNERRSDPPETLLVLRGPTKGRHSAY